MGRGVVNDEMGELANEKVLAFGGFGVQLPIFRPAGTDGSFGEFHAGFEGR